jgi:predicted nucleic acid-binding protein
VIVLDTTVLIDYLRGQPVVARVLDLTAHGEALATAAINVEEIARGLRDTERGAAQQLFAGLVVLPITGEAGWQAGEWRRSYAARGVTLWQADCLIAATGCAPGRAGHGQPEGLPHAGAGSPTLARRPLSSGQAR